MWQTYEHADLTVIDIEGSIQLKLDESKLPVLSFEGKRPYRIERKHTRSQYVDSGFSHAGIASVLATKLISSDYRWNMSYSFPKHQYSCHIINPKKVNLHLSADLLLLSKHQFSMTMILSLTGAEESGTALVLDNIFHPIKVSEICDE